MQVYVAPHPCNNHSTKHGQRQNHNGPSDFPILIPVPPHSRQNQSPAVLHLEVQFLNFGTQHHEGPYAEATFQHLDILQETMSRHWKVKDLQTGLSFLVMLVEANHC